MRALFPLLAVLIASTVVAAPETVIPVPDPKVPQGANLDVPTGWKVRLDIADPKVVVGKQPGEGVYFVNMTPGWHVTTGPAAIFYHPASIAKGNYRGHAKIHFFTPEPGHLEGYGIFFGGANLEAADQSYGYFLLRNDRKFLIKKRRGQETAIVRDWTPSDAIMAVEPGKDSVPNELAVEVRDREVAFLINGQQVATVPRAELPTEGLVGLRLNHHVNVHIADFGVAPLPAR